MPIKKAPNWKGDLEDLVAEGKTYAQAQEALQEKYGEEEGKVGVSTFNKLRKLKFPEEKRQEAIAEVADIHQQQTKAKKKLIKVDNKWSTAKQKAGDTSQLAKVLNQVIFFAVPCKSGKLEQKHIDDINLGGGIVNTIAYVFPGLDISNNPIITLIIRVGLLVLKVRKICNTIKNKYAAHDIIGAPEDGMNPDYAGDQPQDGLKQKGLALKDIFSEHPTDAFMKEEGLMDKNEEKR